MPAAERGAGLGLLAALDFELEVYWDNDLRTLNITKMRDGAQHAGRGSATCCGRWSSARTHG